jgi:hypothetical protein
MRHESGTCRHIHRGPYELPLNADERRALSAISIRAAVYTHIRSLMTEISFPFACCMTFGAGATDSRLLHFNIKVGILSAFLPVSA